MAEYDLAVVGGGVNGTGIARDAAGRGLKVLLVEQNDIGAGASFACAALLRTGLAEVRQGAFRRARTLLTEHENLLRNAPHVVRPLRLVTPCPTPGRSAWRTRAELFLCDHLTHRSSPSTRTIDLTHHVCGDPLRRRYTFGFESSGASVDCARLAVLNAVDAGSRGAAIRTRTRLVRAERSDIWTLMLNVRGRRLVTTARAIVNASGAWAAQVNDTVLRLPRRFPIRLVKSSRIVVPGLFDHADGYALETSRGTVFAVPFGTDLTLIEAVNQPFVGNLDAPIPDRGDIEYLCDAANAYFRRTITARDVVWSCATVTCRTEGATGVGDAVLALDAGDRAPLLSVYGGSHTGYRRNSEAALDRLMPYFATRPAWTRDTPLIGGEFTSAEAVSAEFRRRWRFLEPAHAARLARAYGKRAEMILGDARGMDDLGPAFGADLSAAEVRYLMAYEFAETADDVLWRRSRLGLCIGREDQERLARFMASECGRPSR